jgi:hypothetical protein
LIKQTSIYKKLKGKTLCPDQTQKLKLTIERNRIPKEIPKQQNCKCCRLGLIEPVHGQYWKVQATVHNT